MLRALVAFVRRQLSVWIYLLFEAINERFTCWLGPSRSVYGSTPGNLRSYPPVDVFHL
jgi:hypothetical protein